MIILFGHITTLYTKLAHLDKQIQIHCIYPHSQSDAIQLNALDYDPNIDGEPDSVNAVQPSNATQSKKIPSQVPQSQMTALPFAWLPIGLSISPQTFHQISRSMNMTMLNNNEQNTRVITAHTWRYPRTRDRWRNWNDSQFDDAELLYNHNSTEEGNRICCEYSAYFEKVKDQQYSPYHTMQGIEYHIP